MDTLFPLSDIPIVEPPKQPEPEPVEIPVAQCILPDELFPFHHLTELQLKALCLLAYMANIGNSSKFKILALRYHKSLTDMNDIGVTLCRQGYMYYPYGSQPNFNNFEIRSRYLFPLMLFVMDRHPEWEMEFKQIVHQTDYQKSIWAIIKAVYQGDINKLKTANLPTYFWRIDFTKKDFLIDVFRYSFFTPYCLTLSHDATCNLLYDLLMNDLLSDKINVDTERSIERAIELLFGDTADLTNDDRHIKTLMQNLFVHYHFIRTGELIIDKVDIAGLTTDTLSARAVYYLYHGDHGKAIRSFEDAMSLYVKGGGEKNVIDDPLFAFYLMLYYSKQKLNTDIKKRVASFTKKKLVQGKKYLQPAAIIAHHLILQDKTSELKSDLKALVALDNPPQLHQFYQLLVSFFADDAKLAPLKDLPLSSCALLRYEQSAYFSVPDEDQLRATLGGEPLLANYSGKAAWEMIFDELLSDPNAVAVGKVQERVAYISDGDGFIPYKQRQLRNGTWSAPMPISLKSYMHDEITCTNDDDRRIISALHRNGSRYADVLFTPDNIFPFLINSDRVYYRGHRGNKLETVTIKEEKPFLTVEKGQKSFIIKSNAGSKITEQNVVLRHSDTSYSVFHFSDSDFNLYSRLTSINYIPLTAEPLLKKYLAELSSQIEIHSTLITGGSSLEQVQGLAQLTLRVIPNDVMFDVHLFVRPLASGAVLCEPGEGDAVIYDTYDKQRFQVNRQLHKEKKLLTELVDFVHDSLETQIANLNFTLSLEKMLNLIEFISSRDNDYVVEWPDGYKLRLLLPPTEAQPPIRLKSRENWLEVEGEIKIDRNDVISYAHILRLLSDNRESQRYVRLDNNDFLALSDDIMRQLKRLEQLSTFESKQPRIPMYQTGAVAAMLSHNSQTLHSDKALQRQIERINKATATTYEIPKTLRAQLRDYQVDGYQWMMRLMEWGAGACLADDMGLGKTVQSIAVLLQKAAEGPSLVVAPASVVANWQQELQRFAPTLNPLILNEATDRAETLNALKPYDVLLTTYGLLVREHEALTAKQWNIVCLDEAHVIKNRSTKMSNAAMALRTNNKMILTGTPMQNNLAELWNLFQFLNPGMLGPFEQFNKRFIQPIQYNKDKQRQQVLHRILSPFMLRRTKAEVVEELPDKIEIVRRLELSEVERAHYEALRLLAEKEVYEAERMDVKLLAMITKLRQSACSPALVNELWTADSEKISELISLVSQIVEGDNAVLVFSQFTSFLKMAQQKVQGANIEGLTTLYLDGSTPLPQRKKMVDDFQSGKAQVFFISLKAGGLGLNLTAANYVIHLDPWWNPAVEQQATDRAYRIGQQQNVTVYHLISSNTIEDKILRLHKSKRDLADALLNDQNTTTPLTLDDLKMLVEQ